VVFGPGGIKPIVNQKVENCKYCCHNQFFEPLSAGNSGEWAETGAVRGPNAAFKLIWLKLSRSRYREVEKHRHATLMKRSLGSALIVAGVSLFFLLPALLAENLAPKNHEPPHGSALESPVPPKLTFGSQVILEHLWSPAELKGEASLTQKSPPPVPPKPQTLLPPVPAPWQNSIRKVNPLQNRKVAALTFDLCEGAPEISGYDAGIVNYLRAQRVKATFFAGGKWLQSHPEQALQLMADPLFEIGNHSWSHPHFRGLSEPAVEDQILRTQAQYEALWRELARRAQAKGLDPAEMIKIPRAPLTFRFPYGTCSPSALGILARLGLPAIQWDIVTGDPDKHQYANRIARTILSKIQPGSIIICHANGRGVWTAEALPLVIPRLRDLGFTLVTVSELLHYGPALTTPDCYAGSKPGSRSMATLDY
jgi:peptidoglycan/xylan/chitin deacetylase (PgdA/CDA1 family)